MGKRRFHPLQTSLNPPIPTCPGRRLGRAARARPVNMSRQCEGQNLQWKSDGLFWMTEKFDPKGRTYDKEPLALN